MTGVTFTRLSIPICLIVVLIVSSLCISEAKEKDKKPDGKEAKVVAVSVTTTAKPKSIPVLPKSSTTNKTLSITSTTKKPEKKELIRKKTARSVQNPIEGANSLKTVSKDLTAAEGHEKKYMIVKKKPKKKKPKKIKMKVYEPKIKYKKVKVKVPVKKYKKKKVKGYLVKKKHHY